MRNVSDKDIEKNKKKTYFTFKIFLFSKIVPFMRYCGRVCCSRTGHRWQYGACTLNSEHGRIQTHTQNM